jgi:dephospho-CoA kinase
MKLIGISGTNGSGKDIAAELLAEKYDFLFITVTEMLRAECRKRGIEVSRENLRMVSAEWRREGGLAVLVDKAVEQFKPDEQKYTGLVVASLRNPGEALRVHELGGTVMWMDADPQIRYKRIHNSHRGRDEEDQKTYEEFLAEEEAEMHSSDPSDPNLLNMSAVHELCDVTVLNESDLTALQQSLASALNL